MSSSIRVCCCPFVFIVVRSCSLSSIHVHLFIVRFVVSVLAFVQDIGADIGCWWLRRWSNLASLAQESVSIQKGSRGRRAMCRVHGRQPFALIVFFVVVLALHAFTLTLRIV